MKISVNIERLNNSNQSAAEDIRSVQVAGYSLEAVLIGVDHFPPALRTTANVRSSPGPFLGAYIGTELVGVVEIESGQKVSIGISSLVVHPQWHRRGVGRTLLKYVLESYGRQEIQVQTAARNLPALALYREAGFVEEFRWVTDEESLELVALRWWPSSQHWSA